VPRTAVAFACLLATGCWPSGKHHVEIRNLGSDTMLEVGFAWAETYDKVNDHVVVSLSGGGSGTGIAELIAGQIHIANSSRRLKDVEKKRAEARGRHPVEHLVGYDGIAIYVHRDNPLSAITLQQLKALFGDAGEIVRWSQLGIDLGSPALDTIVPVSRQNNSGTYEYFRDAVLGGSSGRFRRECMNLNGSKDVVEFCARTKSAIGYSGLAYATAGVRMVPVIKKDGAAPVTPGNDTVLDGTYPIARPLFMYTNGEPVGAVKDYLDWIKSDDGQRVLQAHGYPPIRRL
jgi:phosphate transport system substrate-binding protein